MKQNRFKSVVTWAALVSLILSILVQCGVLLPNQSEAIKGALTGVLEMMVVFGVLNDPTNPVEF